MNQKQQKSQIERTHTRRAIATATIKSTAATLTAATTTNQITATSNLSVWAQRVAFQHPRNQQVRCLSLLFGAHLLRPRTAEKSSNKSQQLSTDKETIKAIIFHTNSCKLFNNLWYFLFFNFKKLHWTKKRIKKLYFKYLSSNAKNQ